MVPDHARSRSGATSGKRDACDEANEAPALVAHAAVAAVPLRRRHRPPERAPTSVHVAAGPAAERHEGFARPPAHKGGGSFKRPLGRRRGAEHGGDTRGRAYGAARHCGRSDNRRLGAASAGAGGPARQVAALHRSSCSWWRGWKTKAFSAGSGATAGLRRRPLDCRVALRERVGTRDGVRCSPRCWRGSTAAARSQFSTNCRRRGGRSSSTTSPKGVQVVFIESICARRRCSFR